jgi:uncharacterized protein YfbU (UPF0304 family)
VSDILLLVYATNLEFYLIISSKNINVNQNQQINEQYINKFGFDVTSEIQKIKTTYNFDTISISKDDAKFFADLVENKDFAL